ncbi:class I SAM-dependent methyltransferase [Glycomyces harbinensis]|uniref:Methyltransferase domain-containing protein n=1 Tax=Glycomyces harbinensis TaxID=58114 RepID=A0A1G6Y653_9ACTN|nr:class I SAM-dependent methyltransferase [Glycomyces harbinensis]SDD85830.1 Methyltransferase domain-containing protein [Glycomyces harbinensis]
MSPDHENSSALADQTPTGDYDGFAEAYAAETESSLLNGYYARPAIVDLAGDVAGRRILDVGCGAGPLFESLRERGAIVTGVDPSIKMLELARRRLGEDAALQQADLNDPLPFPDDTFDDAVACLVLHYLEDWTAPLAELRRVLVPGGRLIVAVNHPWVYKYTNPDSGSYFSTHEYGLECNFSGQNVLLSQWHRPLQAVTGAFIEAGFRISVISEPPPAPEAHKLFPEDVKTPDSAFLCFLFLVLEAA